MGNSSSQDTDANTSVANSAQQLSRRWLLFVLLLLAVAFVMMLKMFLIPVILAASFSGLFYPFYKLLKKKMGERENLASVTTCLILLICLLLPVSFIIQLVALEAIDLYGSSEEMINQIVSEGAEGPLNWINKTIPPQIAEVVNIDWEKSLKDIAKVTGKIIAEVVNKTSRGTFQFVANLFIILFTMFYFFRDGEKLLKRLKYLSPLDDEYENLLIKRFVSVSKATLKGSLLLGLIQGSMGAVTLWAFGVSSAVLWGMVMVVLSVIPMVGAWLVLYPAAIIQIAVGHVWQGVTIILITAIIIGNIDNLLRPRLVGKDAGMHDLMIFFSTVGGIGLFGVMGFIIGPILAALFLTILDIYGLEFSQQLNFSSNRKELDAVESDKENLKNGDIDESDN